MNPIQTTFEIKNRNFRSADPGWPVPGRNHYIWGFTAGQPFYWHRLGQFLCRQSTKRFETLTPLMEGLLSYLTVPDLEKLAEEIDALCEAEVRLVMTVINRGFLTELRVDFVDVRPDRMERF